MREQLIDYLRYIAQYEVALTAILGATYSWVVFRAGFYNARRHRIHYIKQVGSDKPPELIRGPDLARIRRQARKEIL